MPALARHLLYLSIDIRIGRRQPFLIRKVAQNERSLDALSRVFPKLVAIFLFGLADGRKIAVERLPLVRDAGVLANNAVDFALDQHGGEFERCALDKRIQCLCSSRALCLVLQPLLRIGVEFARIASTVGKPSPTMPANSSFSSGRFSTFISWISACRSTCFPARVVPVASSGTSTRTLSIHRFQADQALRQSWEIGCVLLRDGKLGILWSK